MNRGASIAVAIRAIAFSHQQAGKVCSWGCAGAIGHRGRAPRPAVLISIPRAAVLAKGRPRRLLRADRKGDRAYPGTRAGFCEQCIDSIARRMACPLFRRIFRAWAGLIPPCSEARPQGSERRRRVAIWEARAEVREEKIATVMERKKVVAMDDDDEEEDRRR